MREPLVVIAVSVVMLFGPRRFVPWIFTYLLAFVLGMIAAEAKTFDKVHWGGGAIALGVFAALGFYLRPRLGAELDGFVAFLIVAFVYSVSIEISAHRLQFVNRALVFLGKHSMNIFFLHTFIRSCWFPGFFNSHNPLVTFSVLQTASVLCSVMIEQLKRMVRFERLLSLVRKA